MLQTDLFGQPVASRTQMVKPETAKKELAEKMVGLKAKIAAREMPVRQGVVVTFEDWPAFAAARGIEHVTVEFPLTGAFAGEMVVRRVA